MYPACDCTASWCAGFPAIPICRQAASDFTRTKERVFDRSPERLQQFGGVLGLAAQDADSAVPLRASYCDLTKETEFK
jgi:hypothetical protein